MLMVIELIAISPFFAVLAKELLRSRPEKMSRFDNRENGDAKEGEECLEE
jgi:hypothetical protein